MKNWFKKQLTAVKEYLRRAVRALTHFEGIVKTAIITTIGGGLNVVVNELVSTGHVALTAENYIQLKAKFVSGAVIAFGLWLKAAPLFSQNKQAAPVEPPAAKPQGF